MASHTLPSRFTSLHLGNRCARAAAIIRSSSWTALVLLTSRKARGLGHLHYVDKSICYNNQHIYANPFPCLQKVPYPVCSALPHCPPTYSNTSNRTHAVERPTFFFRPHNAVRSDLPYMWCPALLALPWVRRPVAVKRVKPLGEDVIKHQAKGENVNGLGDAALVRPGKPIGRAPWPWCPEWAWSRRRCRWSLWVCGSQAKERRGRLTWSDGVWVLGSEVCVDATGRLGRSAEWDDRRRECRIRTSVRARGFLPLCGFRLLLGMLLGNEVAGAELRGGGGQGMLK